MVSWKQSSASEDPTTPVRNESTACACSSNNAWNGGRAGGFTLLTALPNAVFRATVSREPSGGRRFLGGDLSGCLGRKRDRHLEDVALAPDGQEHGVAGLAQRHSTAKLVGAAIDRVRADAGDDVTGQDPRRLRRRPRLDLADLDAVCGGQVLRGRDLAGDRPHRSPERDVLLLAVLARQKTCQLHRVVADQEPLPDLYDRDHNPPQPAEEDRRRGRVVQDVPLGVLDGAL